MSAKKTDKKKKSKKQIEKPVLKPRIEKISVNIGVGEAGEKLKKAETVLGNITGQKPVQTLSRTTSKDWALRKRMPIGCKVTLRGKKADDFFVRALKTRNNKIADYSFDEQGNLSFGIPDHTLFEDQKYDPNIGIFGMDISVTMERIGYRVKKRRLQRKKLPQRHRVKTQETIDFISEKYKVEVV